MANITKPIILDETGKGIIEQLSTQNQILSSLARGTVKGSWREVASVMKSGAGKSVFNVGDMFFANCKRDAQNYNVPFHVCGVRDVIVPTGAVKEALILQPHKVLPVEIMFDAYEAFYKVKAGGLSAGTYHIVMGDDFGDHIKSGDAWSFTLTQPVPEGGVLTGFENLPYSGADGMKIRSYTKNADTEAIEEVTPKKSASGIKLCDLTIKGTPDSNGLQQVCYGYDKYDKSYIRQWCNSTGKEFWVSQHDYDRPPSNYKSVDGFLTGFDEEFVSVLGKFKSVTGVNTAYDSGGTTETFDLVTPPSLEEMYIKKQVSGEGEALPYWVEAIGTPEPREWYKDTPELVHLDMNGTARYVWLRSASVGGAYGSWNVRPSGNVNYGNARNAYCVAPLVAIY